MDPVSVLQIAGFAAGAAKGALEISKDLYVLYKDARNIDQTIQGLVAEVHALGNVCALVDERLRGIVDELDNSLSNGGPAKTRLWNCVELQVRDSRKTIDQLHLAIQDVLAQGTGVISLVWRQIKLNTKTKDIGEARNRIRSHTACLQMVLQTVAIELSNKGDQHLQTLLLKAEECVDRLKAIQANSTEVDIEQREREAEIIAVSEASVSEAHMSIYGASVANCSVIGDPTGRSSHVHGWLQDVTAIESTKAGLDTITESDLHSAISDEPSTIFTEDPRRISTAPTSVAPYEHHREMPELDVSPSDGEEDTEHDLLIDAAKEALESGMSSFQNNEYREASEDLQEALKIIRELPEREQGKVCDTWKIRYLLSVCAFHTESLTDAKSQLWSVVDYASRNPLQTNEQRKQWCTAGHLLSIICIKLESLEEARQYCQSAYNARNKLCGKTHPNSFESLALLARILLLQGQTQRSKIYSRLLPKDKRDSYVEKFENLGAPAMITSNDMSAGSTLDSPSMAPSMDPKNSPKVKSQHHCPTYNSRRPPLSASNSSDSNISAPFDSITAMTTLKAAEAPRPLSAHEPAQYPANDSRRVPIVKSENKLTAITTRSKEYGFGSYSPAREPVDSPQAWQKELDQAFPQSVNPRAEPELRRVFDDPVATWQSRSNETTSTASAPHIQIHQIKVQADTNHSTKVASNNVSEGAEFSPVKGLSQRAPSFDDRASLLSSPVDAEESLLAQIENPAERREIAALLPQMRTISSRIVDIRKRAYALEQRYQKPLPRECILETNRTERAHSAAWKYAWSSRRPSTRPEVQNAEQSVRLATQALANYESSLGTSENLNAAPSAPSKKSTFSRLKGFGSAEKVPQDILIETRNGDIRVRLIDDSKPCKQFLARAQEGSFTEKDLQVTKKGLQAGNHEQSFLITRAPTRILDEKFSLVGYVLEGFELIDCTFQVAEPLRILDCRLTSSVEPVPKPRTGTSGPLKPTSATWNFIK